MSSFEIYEKEYEITMSMVNINRRLGIYGLLNIIQDLAAIHGTIQGYGYDIQIKNNKFWVLVGQKVKMKKWPKWGDKIKFKTWIRPIEGKIIFRDVEFYHNDELLGECCISWLLMDGETRKMTAMIDHPAEFKMRQDYSLNFIPDRLQKRDDLEVINERMVRVTDLDVNNHMNNTKYTQWVLDTIDLHYHKKMFLSEFEINFLAEAKLNDVIEISRSGVGENKVETQFFGLRKSDSRPIFISNFKGEILESVMA